MSERRLRRDAAAKYIQESHGVPCSKDWLAKLACTGGGPPYVKIGKFPMYATSDVDEWVAARTSPLKYSTSDRGR